MNIDDPKILALQVTVAAMAEEFDMATTFHEVWKPAATDRDLQERLGPSYASQAFLVIRTALGRKMLMALTRMWDSNKQGLRMRTIPDALGEPGLLEAFVQDRADHIRVPEVSSAMLVDLMRMADKVKPLIRKYMAGGTHEAVLETAVSLRQERLAHQ